MTTKLIAICIFILLLFIGNCHATDYTSDANCMGAWAMTSDGNETDLSGEGETLTESGGDDIPTGSAYPYINTGASRDFELGDTEYLYHADGGSTDFGGSDQPLSVCAWVKRESDTGGNEMIVAKWVSSLGKRSWLLFIDGGGSPDFFQFQVDADGSSGGTGSIVADTAPAAGTWYHVCGVYRDDGAGGDDDQLEIYINGYSDASPTSYGTGLYNGAAEFQIGAYGGTGAPGGHFDGTITEAIVFDRALSASEVLDIYLHGIDGSEQIRRRVLVNK